MPTRVVGIRKSDIRAKYKSMMYIFIGNAKNTMEDDLVNDPISLFERDSDITITIIGFRMFARTVVALWVDVLNQFSIRSRSSQARASPVRSLTGTFQLLARRDASPVTLVSCE